MNVHYNPGGFQTQMSGKHIAATDTEVLPLSQRRAGDKGLLQRLWPCGEEHLVGARS